MERWGDKDSLLSTLFPYQQHLFFSFRSESAASEIPPCKTWVTTGSENGFQGNSSRVLGSNCGKAIKYVKELHISSHISSV